MTMDLSGQAFFKAYLKALTDTQLRALWDWNGERLSDSPDDAVRKRELIAQEMRRRNGR
jgi:hypothetical protein